MIIKVWPLGPQKNTLKMISEGGPSVAPPSLIGLSVERKQIEIPMNVFLNVAGHIKVDYMFDRWYV